MVDANTLLAYVCVVLGLFLVPGPAVLLVLGRATTGGRRVGIATGIGIACGDFFHAAAAALGLSAVLMTSALAFSMVKYAGVAYLVYLGIRALVERNEDVQIVRSGIANPSRAFRQAVLAEILNPKTALFFLAFLPQFVHPEHGSVVAQLAFLGAVFVVMSAAYTSLIALVAGRIGAWLNGNRHIARWRGPVIGSIYIALGLRLALQEQ